MDIHQNAREMDDELFDIDEYSDDIEILYDLRESFIYTFDRLPTYEEILGFAEDRESVLNRLFHQQLNSYVKNNGEITIDVIKHMKDIWNLNPDKVSELIDLAAELNELEKMNEAGHDIDRNVDSKYGIDWILLDWCFFEEDSIDDILDPIYKRFIWIESFIDVHRYRPSDTLCQQKWGKDFSSLISDILSEVLIKQLNYSVVDLVDMLLTHDLITRWGKDNIPMKYLLHLQYTEACDSMIRKITFTATDDYLNVNSDYSPWYIAKHFPLVEDKRFKDACDSFKSLIFERLPDNGLSENQQDVTQVYVSSAPNVTPLYFNETVSYMLFQKEKYFIDYHRMPTEEELLKYWGIPSESFSQVIGLYHRFRKIEEETR